MHEGGRGGGVEGWELGEEQDCLLIQPNEIVPISSMT